MATPELLPPAVALPSLVEDELDEELEDELDEELEAGGVLAADAVMTKGAGGVVLITLEPGTLMATVLLLGNYTGYKLSELKRFKPLVDEMKSGATPGKDK